MKFLIIGLGSMGKRRIRCLKSLGYTDIYGYDLRPDRIEEAINKYSITPLNKIEENILESIDIMIISTPPDKHLEYIELAVKYKKPAFVEASVLYEHTHKALEITKDSDVFIAPSCTLIFHPVIKEIVEIVNSGKYGKITNFSYHSGQYLPDWHPWENIRDFYVSKRETGGAREIVPFELTWICHYFGFPNKVQGYFGKSINLGVDIDDTYVINLKFDNFFGSMVVDVTSRFATRSLILNLEKAQIRWNWEENYFRIYEAEKRRWIYLYLPEYHVAEGYNKNIIEDMYIEEIKMFLNGIKNPKIFPNNLSEDLKILSLLKEIEMTN
jgi:predicted dehydrogenase